MKSYKYCILFAIFSLLFPALNLFGAEYRFFSFSLNVVEYELTTASEDTIANLKEELLSDEYSGKLIVGRDGLDTEILFDHQQQVKLGQRIEQRTMLGGKIAEFNLELSESTLVNQANVALQLAYTDDLTTPGVDSHSVDTDIQVEFGKSTVLYFKEEEGQKGNIIVVGLIKVRPVHEGQ